MLPAAGPVRRGSGPARLTLLRDPPLGLPRPAVRRAQRRTGTGPPHRAKTRHNAVTIACTCWCAGCTLRVLRSSRCCRLRRRRQPGWHDGTAGAVAADLPSPSSTSCWSTVRSPVSARCGRSSARSTSCRSGGTSGSGRSRRRLHPDVQRHAVQGRHLAAARRADRPPGLRRRLLDHRAEPGQRGQLRTLAAGSIIQSPFPRGRRLQVRLHRHRDGCRIGSGAFVHYGVTMGEGSRSTPIPS